MTGPGHAANSHPFRRVRAAYASRRRLVPALILLSVLIGCGQEKSVELGQLVKPGQAAGFNVLLVTLDTVSSDLLGCYGNKHAQTPTFDALAAGGVQFDDAITSVPLTLPSHTTILTGLYPPNHGVRDNGTFALDPDYTTLPEILKTHGYSTAAFIGCFVLDGRFGLDQGFDTYDFTVTREGYKPRMVDYNERSAAQVTDAATAWLDRHHKSGTDDPFFVWVHYFDPHMPYRSPYQDRPQFKDRPYDAEVAYVDEQAARLFARLDRHGWRDNTLVVVVADHGESLGEHDEEAHGMFIYNSTLRVPFILSCPSLITGPHHVRDQIVGLVDVRATIEDLLGVTSSVPDDGRSLIETGGDAPRSIYIESEAPLHMAGWSPLYGLQRHDSKYILAPIPEFYDLIEDPQELQNLYAMSRPGQADMARELDDVRSGWSSADGAGRTMTDEEIERLESLGYAHTSGSRQSESLPDPKSMIELYNKGMEAETLYTQKRYREAEILARMVCNQCELCSNAWRVLAFSQLKLGRPSAAIATLRESVERDQNVYLIRSLAQILILSEDCEAAEEVLQLYETIAPTDGRVAILRGDCLDRLGHPEEAIVQYRIARQLDENRVGIQATERIARVRQRHPAPPGQR